jgi:hypothetical protein
LYALNSLFRVCETKKRARPKGTNRVVVPPSFARPGESRVKPRFRCIGRARCQLLCAYSGSPARLRGELDILLYALRFQPVTVLSYLRIVRIFPLLSLIIGLIIAKLEKYSPFRVTIMLFIILSP